MILHVLIAMVAGWPQRHQQADGCGSPTPNVAGSRRSLTRSVASAL